MAGAAFRTDRVETSFAGVGQLLNSAEALNEIKPRAERVLASAQSSAPVLTGAYRDGLHLVQDTTDRVVMRVVGGTDYDMIVEADTGNLARALDSAAG